MLTKITNMFSFVSTLSGVRRFSLMKQVHPENVLEHTGMVTIFALLIAKDIAYRRGEAWNCDKTKDAVLEALLHDWDEAATGDIVRPTKYYSETLLQELRKAAETGVRKIGDNLDFPHLGGAHSALKDKGTDAGFICAVADTLCAAHRIWEEAEINGNKQMLNCIPHTRNALEDLKILGLQDPLFVITNKYIDSALYILENLEKTYGFPFVDITKEV